MTRSIEDELNLPRLEDALKELGQQIPPEETLEESEDHEAVSNFANMLEHAGSVTSDQLDPLALGQDEHAEEMDEVYTKAMRVHEELKDLGFNIEAKHAGSIMGPAAQFLEMAMKAANSKHDSRMKAAKLRMEREKLDHELRKNQTDGVIEGDASAPGGIVADRNDLMKKLRNKDAK